MNAQGSNLAEEIRQTLHAYLTRNIKAGVIDFSIRAEIQDADTVKFYIHPASVSGETEDFLLWEDPITEFDLLMSEHLVPRPDPERFIEMLKASTRNQLSREGK